MLFNLATDPVGYGHLAGFQTVSEFFFTRQQIVKNKKNKLIYAFFLLLVDTKFGFVSDEIQLLESDPDPAHSKFPNPDP